MSRDSRRIQESEHKAWLTRVLDSSKHVIRIAEVDGKPVGVVRADETREGWELSWNVAPEARQQGFGGRMLKTFVDGIDGRVTATIRSGNEASTKTAAAAGLARVNAIDGGRFERWARGEKQR